jgi:hypothetical protein
MVVLSAALAACFVACKPGGEEGAPSTGSTAPLGAEEMKTALIEALANPDTLDRIDAVTDLMRRIDAKNVEGAMAAYDDSVEGLDRDEVRLFANAWARIDPKSALDRFTHWRAPRVGQSAIAEVVFYWTRNGGADAAREYALSSLGDLPDGKTIRNIVLDSTAAGLASAGQYESLTKLLEPLPSDQPRSWVITQAMLEFYRAGPSALRDWVDSIPWEAQNDLKRDALRSALIGLSNIDGPRAFEWYEAVESRLAPGDFLEGMSQAWSGHEPLRTIEWLRTRPESEGRRMALRAAAYRYLKSDGKAASEWIKANLEDPSIDESMRFPLAQYTMSVDLQGALPLAEKIPAPGEKLEALKQILIMWSRTDFDAVEKYMTEVGVPYEVEQAVRSMNTIRRQQKEQQKAQQKEQQKQPAAAQG